MTYPLITYEIKTGEVQIFDITGFSFAAIWDGCPVLINKEQQLYLQGIESGERSLWMDAESIRYYHVMQCADFLLIEANPEDDYECKYYMCHCGEKVLHSLNVPYEMNISVAYESDTVLYLCLIPQKEESTSSEWKYELIQKTEILKWMND